MSFFAFLFFILLLLLLLPAFLLQKVIGWWRRVTGQGPAPGYSYYDRGQYREGQRHRQHQQQQHPRKKKIFSKNEGEYVDFEEITVNTSYTGENGNVKYETEEQVSDAEWTEIK